MAELREEVKAAAKAKAKVGGRVWTLRDLGGRQAGTIQLGLWRGSRGVPLGHSRMYPRSMIKISVFTGEGIEG